MSQYVINATTQTFEQDVIQRSQEALVLVDFWAAWCQPCRVLGPHLEQAVERRSGAVWLVKVDTDQNPELAAQFGIRGIPAVKAFYRGALVDEFVGVRQGPELEAFIDRLLPSGERQVLEQAEAMLTRGEARGVAELLAPLLDQPQLRDEALLLSARARARLGQKDEALALLDQLSEKSLLAEQAEHLRVQLELLAAGSGADGEELAREAAARDTTPQTRWSLAGWYYAAGRTEEALDTLLELLQRDRRFNDDGARKAIVALLDELGPESPLARAVRRQLQIYI